MSQIKDPQVATDIWPRLDDLEPDPGTDAAMRLADRSCCCSAPPAFTVTIATNFPVPHSVDLLMCGHHYRKCAATLARLTALVFDHDRHLVATAVSP